jgi:D-mannonate dehydratase
MNMKIIATSWWFILLVIVVYIISCFVVCSLTRDISNFFGIKTLKYNLNPVIEYMASKNENISRNRKEWLEMEHLKYDGDYISGDRYYTSSKYIALDVANAFKKSGSVAIHPNSNMKVYSKFEQFAPLLFQWQCKFDISKGALCAFESKELQEEWRHFLREEIMNNLNYNIYLLDSFNETFDLKYANYSH